MEMIKRFLNDEEGATMVEYALMLALIAAVCVAAVGLIGSKASALFGSIGSTLSSATS